MKGSRRIFSIYIIFLTIHVSEIFPCIVTHTGRRKENLIPVTPCICFDVQNHPWEKKQFINDSKTNDKFIKSFLMDK